MKSTPEDELKGPETVMREEGHIRDCFLVVFMVTLGLLALAAGACHHELRPLTKPLAQGSQGCMYLHPGTYRRGIGRWKGRLRISQRKFHASAY